LDLHDAKFRVNQLRKGMKREQVDAVLQPPDSSLYDISISGITVTSYQLKPNLWIQLDFQSDNSLIRVPGEFSSKYGRINLTDIK